MRNYNLLVVLLAFCTIVSTGLEARIKLIEFTNKSDIQFNETFVDGTPYNALLASEGGVLIDRPGAVIESVDGDYKLIFEDAHRSGYDRPHWKFHVWIESKKGFPLLGQNKFLFAVIFYDGDGNVRIKFDKKGRLHVMGGYDVSEVFYPWSNETTKTRNPYLKIVNECPHCR